MTNDGYRRVGVIAADPLRLVGLEAILNEIPSLEPVAVRLEFLPAEAERLSAAVLDSRIASGEGLIELIGKLRREIPAVRLIVLGESPDPSWVERVIGAGAKGYLLETAGEDEIRMALDVVLDGSVWAPRKVLARLIDSGGVSRATAAAQAGPVFSKMTPREQQVLRLLMDGKSNRDIGAAMGIDETTVKAHLGRMLRKTGATNRVELTLRAMDDHTSSLSK
ncbi:MAG: response regulator transcription factor [Acidobacteriaceae bacterium]|nr:response regulator transcription factor [Acidobacteriaceae bacterium]